MRALLVLAALGWMMSLPWAAVLGYLVLIVAAILILWFLSVSIERWAASPRRGHTAIDADYVAALEVLVAEAEVETRMLRAEIAELRASPPVAARSQVAVLHARGAD